MVIFILILLNIALYMVMFFKTRIKMLRVRDMEKILHFKFDLTIEEEALKNLLNHFPKWFICLAVSNTDLKKMAILVKNSEVKKLKELMLCKKLSKEVELLMSKNEYNTFENEMIKSFLSLNHVNDGSLSYFITTIPSRYSDSHRTEFYYQLILPYLKGVRHKVDFSKDSFSIKIQGKTETFDFSFYETLDIEAKILEVWKGIKRINETN